MSEIHRKQCSDRFEGRICSVLKGFDSVSSLQTKAEALKTDEMGCGKAFWRLLPHNSEIIHIGRKELIKWAPLLI